MNLSLNPQIKAVNRNLFNRLKPYFLLGSFVICVVLVTVVTLVYSTKQVTKGYVINFLDQENQKLVRQMEVLDMKLNDVKSLKNIRSTEKIKNMRNPEIIVYIKGENSIASR
jgi:hypothetical protein